MNKQALKLQNARRSSSIRRNSFLIKSKLQEAKQIQHSEARMEIRNEIRDNMEKRILLKIKMSMIRDDEEEILERFEAIEAWKEKGSVIKLN